MYRNRNRNDRFSLVHYRFIVAILVLPSFFLAGCASLIKYSKAQDHFNAAVEADMAQRFVPTPDINTKTVAVASSQAKGNYALTLKLIREVIDRDKEGLQKDGLYGNALTIKAISEWKTGNYDDACKTAKSALQVAKKGQLFPRDHALMVALPGLIKTDQAFFHTMNKDSKKTYEQIKKLIYGNYGAKKDFEDALALVGDKHPIRIYVMMSELAAIRTLQVAIEKKISDMEGRKEARKVLREKHRDPIFEEFRSTLTEQKLDKEAQWSQVLGYWEFLLGI